jgi:hypothetical protein
VFRNPPGDHAARLIESCGLKGSAHRWRGVSTKHANFIVNPRGAACAADIEADRQVRARHRGSARRGDRLCIPRCASSARLANERKSARSFGKVAVLFGGKSASASLD